MNKLLANLKLWQKFALLGAITAIMVGAPLVGVISSALRDMRVTQGEIEGLAPANSVIRLLQLTQQHRGLSAAVQGGDSAAQPAREAKQAEVEKALADAKVLAATLASSRMAARADRLLRDWRALAQAVGARSLAPNESFARHTELIEAELDLLDDVTEASGLALDPEAGTYYLMLAATSYLPSLTELLGQARAKGSLILARGQADPVDRAVLATMAERLQRRFAGVRSTVERAGAADPLIVKSLEKPLAGAVSAAEHGLELLDEKLVRAQQLSYPSAQFFAGMTAAVDAQFALVNVTLELLTDELQARLASQQRSLSIIALVVVAGLGLLVWAMLTITRLTTRGVAQAMELAAAMSEGDLTQEVYSDSRDEIGRLLAAMRQMQASLRNVVGQVRTGIDSVATASSQIAQGNHDLSSRTEQQASNLQQAAASMEQMTGTVKASADNARAANQLAAGASDVAAKGGQVVAQVVATMGDIQASSSKIADIIGVIDGIAFQTNILALNAAVEAARAGEQGRGFAVVAAEVRSLAQRSAEAAREIKSLIGTSVEKVDAGSALVDEAGRTMAEIVSQVRRVTDLIGEIAAGSNEQTDGIAQVNSAVDQLDQMTQQNAALVEQSAAAAQSLAHQAQRLAEAVGVFKLGHERAGQAIGTPQAGLGRPLAATTLSFAAASLAADDAPLDFSAAIRKHADWKHTLRNAAMKGESLDADTIRRDDCCTVGQWLHGAGKSDHGQRASFTALIEKHRNFHQAAGKVADTINRGEARKAIDMLASGTVYARASNEVGAALVQLREELAPPVRPAATRRAGATRRPAPTLASGGDADWQTF